MRAVDLGRGGMGSVYRAVDRKLDEDVAIKLLGDEITSDRKTIERFATELKLARRIVHKNVGRVYELMEDKGTPFITMEFVPGENLKRLIKRVGRPRTCCLKRVSRPIPNWNGPKGTEAAFVISAEML